MFRFTCDEMDLSWNIVKFQKIMTRIVWKIFFCSLNFQWWFWRKKVSSINKMPISKIESFLKSNFGWNQICKIVLTQNHQIWNFNVSDSRYFFFFFKIGEMLWSYRKCRKIEVWRKLVWVLTKICLLRQSRTKHLEQNREIQ